MKPFQRVLTAAVLLLLGAAVWYWALARKSPGKIIFSAAPNLPFTPQPAQAKPAAAAAVTPHQAAAAISPRPGIEDRFKDCPVIAQRQDARTEHGVAKLHRLRLVRKVDFKYPVVRVEDELLREPGGDRLVKQSAMVGDHVLVKVRDPNMDETVLLRQLKDAGATLRRKMPGSDLWLIAFADPGLDTVPQAISRLSALDQWVRFAEPDYLIQATTTPNDPSFATQWGMNNTGQSGGTPHADIQASDAWTLSTGSATVVVGVVDSGVDLTHPDLAANIWTNVHEIPGNGIDDDANGFVDDVHGWDFVHNANNPNDDYGHGTHCAGIIGAVGNNAAGVSGVCWQVALMPLKFLNASGTAASSDAVAAISYATHSGATLTSNSYSIVGEGYSQSMKDVIDEADAAGVLFVTATGNLHTDLDASPAYPAGYTSANLISVAATTRLDELAAYSNYGAASADLAAPGSDIYSTLMGGGYGLNTGTSMAAPHVAGACALLKSLNPLLTHSEIKNLILSSVDVIPSLAGKTVTGGRLNAYHALIASNDILVSRGADFSSAGLIGGPFTPASKSYTLTNHQTTSAAWTAAVNRTWISPSPASGTLAPGQSVTVTFTFNAEAPAMLAGDHTGTITFTSVATGRTYLRNLSVTVSPPALYSYNLNADPGWPRTGAWAFGVPSGQGGTSGGRPDPTTGATGSNVFGINLNGNYSAAIAPAQYLTAGPFDLSAHHACQLRFQRWLNSDYQPWVYATIDVSSDGVQWYPVWDNGSTITQTDYHWTQVTYDLPPAMMGQSQVYVRWRHEVASSDPVPLSGWNLDDVEILGIPNRQIRLTLPAYVTEGGTDAPAKISMVPAVDSDVVINLSSDHPGEEVNFPATVTIPAGAEEASFQVSPLDDATIDGTQTIAITASAPGFPAHTATLQIRDNESANLTLSLPSNVTEGDGVITGQAEVRLPAPAEASIMINLASSDPSEIQVPATVTIAAGQTAAAFAITVQDDAVIDGPQTVTLTASVDNWPTATSSLQVLDNESRQLTVTLPAARLENSGTLTSAGTVSTAAPVESSLTISLSSDDTSELTVPAQVLLPAGASSATFNLTFQDDALSDGPQTVHISASAATFLTGSTAIIVTDNEQPAVATAPSPLDGNTGSHPESDLSWQTDPDSGGSPDSYDVYFGANPTPGAGQFLGNTAASQWTLARLTPGITYYWQIISRKGVNTRTGPIWSFAVPPVGPVKRFGWDPLPASSLVDTPIAVRLAAFDEWDNPVTTFTGRASLSASVHSPDTTTGAGAAANSTLLGAYYHHARTQVIYQPAEVGAAGTLTSLSLNVTNLPTQTLNNFAIRLKHTSKATYATNPTWETTGWTTVYQSSEVLSSTGWTAFTFQSPFAYNGSSNLMVDISFSNPTFSTDGRCTATPGSTYRSLAFRTDSGDYGAPADWSGATPSGSTSMTLPNIRFGRADVPLTMTPATTGSFVAGAWSGSVTISEGGQDAQLKAIHLSDPSVSGVSATIDIVLINAFALTAEPPYTGGLTNTISWSPLGDGFEYEIQRATTANFTPSVSSGFVSATDYTFTGLTDGATYYYRGRARGDGITGSWSPTVSSTQDATPPSLALTSASGGFTTQDHLTLAGTASDTTSGILSVTINGAEAHSIDSFASWEQPLLNLPDGPATFTVTASDGAVPPNTRTESWTVTRIASPAADSDQNGVPSLMEYAFNATGPIAREALPIVSSEPGGANNDETYLTITFRRRLNPSGLNYIVETSTDLITWHDAGANAEITSSTPTGDGITELLHVRIHPALQAGQTFVRLHVVLP